MLVFNMAKSPIDPTLLLRAFTATSWISVMFFVLGMTMWLGILHFLERQHLNIGKTNLGNCCHLCQ